MGKETPCNRILSLWSCYCSNCYSRERPKALLARAVVKQLRASPLFFFKVQTNKEKVYFCIDLVFNVPIYPAIVGDTAGKLKSGCAKN